MSALLLALLLIAGDEVEEERADVVERLATERAAFEALKAEKQDVLSLLEALEKQARESSQRVGALERAVSKIGKQVARARSEAEVAQAEFGAQQRRLAPRLVSLYRIERQSALAALLSAGDFAAFIKRQRSLKKLVQTDVSELEELAIFATWQHRQTNRLERLEAMGQRYMQALRAEQTVGQARRSRFQELLSSVSTQQQRASRLIAELERTEKELSGMVAQMLSAAVSEFRSRKGRMPYPTDGIVEVGYGKVINPRFNTVTVQKGIDIRAQEGTEVRTVGTGTVVFSDWLKGYGNLIIVDHGNRYHSLYAHLENSEVEVGNAVEEGEAIGSVGDTGSLKGSYLYFEIRKNGQAIDPLPWLGAGK